MRVIEPRKRLAALGCIAVMGAACMAAGSCGTDLHKAEAASAGIAASLNTAAIVNHNDAFESADEKAAVANYIVQVAAANNRFVGVLKVAETQGSAINTATIETALNALVSQVNQLNVQGVLKLKSTNAQADFAIVMSSIQASLVAIEAIYPPLTSQSDPPKRHRWPIAPVMALTLTAEEIEELIAIVIAAGSSLAPKLLALRGQTDAELLASAAADDASAIAIAESDGATAPTS